MHTYTFTNMYTYMYTHMYMYLRAYIGTSSVVEPELEPQRARTFGQSRSWSRYTEVSAPAPGQTKVVYLIIIHIE
jgi:hypothetical protein